MPSEASPPAATESVRAHGTGTARTVTPSTPGPFERQARELSPTRILTIATLVLLPFLALWIFWNGQTAFFLLFSGVLFAALIDACIRGLDRVLHLDRMWGYAIVVGLIVLAVAGLVWFGGSYIYGQVDELVRLIAKQADEVSELVGMVRGENVAESDTAMGVLRQASTLLPGGGGGAVTALNTVQTVFSYLANAVIIFFIGAFLALEPGLYKRGFARLFPPQSRDEVDDALVETGQTLRRWLIGKLASMTMIFLFTWIGLWIVGFPFSFALGMVAGALAFIPNIGPILTYIPIVLVGLSAGSTTTLIYGLVVYAAAQAIESYLFTPLIQKRMVSLPPALIFFAQILGGILFGLWGVALATPIAAVLKTLVEKLYIQEGLEENVDEVDPQLEREAA